MKTRNNPKKKAKKEPNQCVRNPITYPFCFPTANVSFLHPLVEKKALDGREHNIPSLSPDGRMCSADCTHSRPD